MSFNYLMNLQIISTPLSSRAPEIEDCLWFLKKSDVYSFGILIIEVLVGDQERIWQFNMSYQWVSCT